MCCLPGQVLLLLSFMHVLMLYAFHAEPLVAAAAVVAAAAPLLAALAVFPGQVVVPFTS